MKGDAKIVQHLNRVLKNELTAINQYFLHSRMLRNWGLGKLAARAYQESVDEMKHADRLIARILFLEGLPNLQDLDRLMIGESPLETLKCDLAIERKAMPELRKAIAASEEKDDFTSRELFENILEGEEEHVDWLEIQLRLVESLGLENYLQAQI